MVCKCGRLTFLELPCSKCGGTGFEPAFLRASNEGKSSRRKRWLAAPVFLAGVFIASWFVWKPLVLIAAVPVYLELIKESFGKSDNDKELENVYRLLHTGGEEEYIPMADLKAVDRLWEAYDGDIRRLELMLENDRTQDTAARVFRLAQSLTEVFHNRRLSALMMECLMRLPVGLGFCIDVDQVCAFLEPADLKNRDGVLSKLSDCVKFSSIPSGFATARFIVKLCALIIQERALGTAARNTSIINASRLEELRSFFPEKEKRLLREIWAYSATGLELPQDNEKSAPIPKDSMYISDIPENADYFADYWFRQAWYNSRSVQRRELKRLFRYKQRGHIGIAAKNWKRSALVMMQERRIQSGLLPVKISEGVVEQYIYSRSNRRIVNARGYAIKPGYGYVAFSLGMDGAMRDEVLAHCSNVSQFVPEGKPVLRKAYLPECGRVLVQSAVRRDLLYSKPLHVAHGYLLPTSSEHAVRPGSWFSALYRLGDPNKFEHGILLDSLENPELKGHFAQRPLRETMEALGADCEAFSGILAGCFGAPAYGVQFIIAYDTAEDKDLLWRDVLYWIYSCLPYELRLRLGVDSVYTERSDPGMIQIAFLDIEKIPEHEKLKDDTPADEIRVPKGKDLVPLGKNMLFINGCVINGEDITDDDGVFVRWLGAVAGKLWESDGELVKELDKIYMGFREKLERAPEKVRLYKEAYDSVCWESLGRNPGVFAEADEKTRSETPNTEARELDEAVKKYLIT